MSKLRAPRLTLGQLGRRVGLSRTALIYYESLGLLLPSARSAAGYRLYGEAELKRLQTLQRLRDAGLALEDIRALLLEKPQGSHPTGGPAALLEKRLLGLCDTMNRIRGQQRLLARLLAQPGLRTGKQLHDKAGWVAMLQRAGFDDADMERWHVEFEREDPEAHAGFLRSLGIARGEAREIRRWARDKGRT